MKHGHIAIITDEPGWHGEQLLSALSARGYTARYVSLQDCRVDLEGSRYGVILPGFEKHLPDGVFVRGVPNGTLEQVVLRLDVLHILRELGIPVYNDARAIERSVDKAMTSLLLKLHGVPTPATWVTESIQQARAHLIRETAHGRKVVLKPLFGSQGAGLMKLDAPGDLPPPEDYQQVYYLQRFVNSGEGAWHDWRVLVVGGVARAAMLRRGTSWINNVAQGARCEPAPLQPELCDLAQRAACALEMDYAGVDLIRSTDGELSVIEVNGVPAWKGLQSVCQTSIAQILADDFLTRRVRRSGVLEKAR
ncbi:MAG: ATP-grasp domain-containing protein [Burkholderiales bacterium]